MKISARLKSPEQVRRASEAGRLATQILSLVEKIHTKKDAARLAMLNIVSDADLDHLSDYLTKVTSAMK